MPTPSCRDQGRERLFRVDRFPLSTVDCRARPIARSAVSPWRLSAGRDVCVTRRSSPAPTARSRNRSSTARDRGERMLTPSRFSRCGLANIDADRHIDATNAVMDLAACASRGVVDVSPKLLARSHRDASVTTMLGDGRGVAFAFVSRQDDHEPQSARHVRVRQIECVFQTMEEEIRQCLANSRFSPPV